MSSSRPKRKNQPCDYNQIRNPETHTCKACSTFSEMDLREFALTLEVKLNDNMDKKKICETIKQTLPAEKLRQIDMIIRNSRFYVPSLTVNWQPRAKELLSESLLDKVRYHELRAGVKYYTLEALLKQVKRQLSFMVDELKRNDISIYYRRPVDGTYEILEDVESWFKEESEQIEFFEQPHVFILTSNDPKNANRYILMGAVIFKITRDVPKQQLALLEKLNSMGRKYVFQVQYQNGPVEPSPTYDSFEKARSELQKYLQRIGPYYFFKDGFQPVDDNLINLYTRKKGLIMTDSQWFTQNRQPFKFRIRLIKEKLTDQQLNDALQLFFENKQ